MAITHGQFHHLLFGLNTWDARNEIANECQDSVPYASAQSGVEEERTKLHARQTCRNGDELANSGYQTAEESGRSPVVTEILLCASHALLGDEAEMAPTGAGKLIDDGAAQPARQEIVDECTDISSQRGEDNNEDDVHTRVAHREPRRRRHHHLGGEGDKRTLDGHKGSHHPIVEVLQNPGNQCCGIHTFLSFLFICGTKLMEKEETAKQGLSASSA